MSLIRSTSNPEGIYAWVGNNGLNWAIGREGVFVTPARAFGSFVRGYIEAAYPDSYRRHGYCIEEVWQTKGGTCVPADSPTVIIHVRRQNGAFKQRLTYKGRDIAVMWAVTWLYIVSQNRWDK